MQKWPGACPRDQENGQPRPQRKKWLGAAPFTILTAIDDWNALPNNIKGIKREEKFKESLKTSLLAAARKDDESIFLYH